MEEAGRRGQQRTVGFAVADGRSSVVVIESGVAAVFVVLAAAAVTGSAWLLVPGFTGHGLKDLWQHRSHYVANTRWWPPFCLIVDRVVAAAMVVLIILSIHSTMRTGTWTARRSGPCASGVAHGPRSPAQILSTVGNRILKEPGEHVGMVVEGLVGESLAAS
jgi:hypothetical protein